ncbi:hypothetical protein BUALT_Bualt05G0104000 [Buddleja alternifolia]|uniref:DUF4283 domain-containing protein n=1 Tax=Buddleja alternifolia TaxID=168488 RepID=A0AAV6XK33_9LAMI|nr:hypothetical protein BUALT_Bualt05G0104000 [Buddleja alternifolia]
MDQLNALVDSTNLLNVEDHEELQQFDFEDVQTFTLVGKVMSNKTFNSGAVKNILLRAWNCKSRVDVNKFDDNKTTFVFKEKNDLDKVVNLSPWSFRGQLVVLQQWHPDYTVNDIKLDHAQFWLQVSNLPVRLMNTIMAKKIENMLGTFIKTDLVYECQRWKKFLRIRVEVDIKSPLKDIVSLRNFVGGEIEAEIRYERLGEFYFICSCIGHKIASYNESPPDFLIDVGKSFDGSWLVLGDFNAILTQLEKKGGRQFVSSSSGEFKGFMHEGGLIDLGFEGAGSDCSSSMYTWGWPEEIGDDILNIYLNYVDDALSKL